MAEENSGSYEPTDLTRIRRRPERGSYDRALVHSIIDEALVCHVSFTHEGQPYILPTTIVRIEEDIYLHGSPTNRMLGLLAAGAPAAIAVTHIDAIVAGRSGFGCSVDYRSVVVFSSGEVVEGPFKEVVVEQVIQQVVPGHRVRPPKKQELDATIVIRFPLREVSAKVRNIGNKDFEEDYDLDLWAGTIPLKLAAGTPIDAPHLPPHISAPSYATNYTRGNRS